MWFPGISYVIRLTNIGHWRLKIDPKNAYDLLKPATWSPEGAFIKEAAKQEGQRIAPVPRLGQSRYNILNLGFVAPAVHLRMKSPRRIKGFCSVGGSSPNQLLKIADEDIVGLLGWITHSGHTVLFRLLYLPGNIIVWSFSTNSLVCG